MTEVKAVGTAFNVRTRGENVDVLVSKGVVDVRRDRTEQADLQAGRRHGGPLRHGGRGGAEGLAG